MVKKELPRDPGARVVRARVRRDHGAQPLPLALLVVAFHERLRVSMDEP